MIDAFYVFSCCFWNTEQQVRWTQASSCVHPRTTLRKHVQYILAFPWDKLDAISYCTLTPQVTVRRSWIKNVHVAAYRFISFHIFVSITLLHVAFESRKWRKHQCGGTHLFFMAKVPQRVAWNQCQKFGLSKLRMLDLCVGGEEGEGNTFIENPWDVKGKSFKMYKVSEGFFWFPSAHPFV